MTIDFNALAFVFPGQGSQTVGMGSDLVQRYPVARDTFLQADDHLGFSLSRLCFEGPEAELNDTINTQPALYVFGVAMLRVLQSERPDIRPIVVAGHSAGEFAALTAAESLSFEDGLRLIRERGRLMKQAGEQHPGAMAALLGLDVGAVRALCEQARAETGGVLVLANDNCPGQVVVSGDVETLERALALAREAGARRAVRLAVSIASHSPLMQSAADEFSRVLDAIRFAPPRVTVIGNVTAAPLETPDAIADELRVQMVQSVRWTESVRAMINLGARAFLELGPKDVLTGLLRRIDDTATGVALNSVASLDQVLQAANGPP